MIAAMMYLVLDDCFGEVLGCGDETDDPKGNFVDEAAAGAEDVAGGAVVDSRMRQNRLWPLEPVWQA
jgi:hypothetical protein